MKKTFISAFLLAAIITSSCEEKKPASTTAETATLASVSVADEVKITAEEFTQKAYMGSMAEVQLGELAKKKASNKEVKKFAEMMIKDHGNANKELKSIAQKQNMKVPDSISMEMKNMMKELQKQSGKAFDKAYMNNMVKEHEKAAELYQQAVNDLTNQELKKYAQKTMKVIEGHLEQAQSISRTLGEATVSK